MNSCVQLPHRPHQQFPTSTTSTTTSTTSKSDPYVNFQPIRSSTSLTSSQNPGKRDMVNQPGKRDMVNQVNQGTVNRLVKREILQQPANQDTVKQLVKQIQRPQKQNAVLRPVKRDMPQQPPVNQGPDLLTKRPNWYPANQPTSKNLPCDRKQQDVFCDGKPGKELKNCDGNLKNYDGNLKSSHGNLKSRLNLGRKIHSQPDLLSAAENELFSTLIENVHSLSTGTLNKVFIYFSFYTIGEGGG